MYQHVLESVGQIKSLESREMRSMDRQKISITYKSKPRRNINCYLTQHPTVAIHTIKVYGGVSSCEPLSSPR